MGKIYHIHMSSEKKHFFSRKSDIPSLLWKLHLRVCMIFHNIDTAKQN